jgi:hypothetical protein
MTWQDYLWPFLKHMGTALLTAAAMYFGAPAVAPPPPPPKTVESAAPTPVPAMPSPPAALPATVVCDVAPLASQVRLVEGQCGTALSELREWREAERKRLQAEAAAWAARRAAREREKSKQ